MPTKKRRRAHAQAEVSACDEVCWILCTSGYSLENCGDQESSKSGGANKDHRLQCKCLPLAMCVYFDLVSVCSYVYLDLVSVFLVFHSIEGQ